MQKTKKKYVQFTLAGFIFPEIEKIRVKNRDIKSLRIPATAYALQFFDILSFKASLRGRRRTARRAINFSPLYNIGTKIYTFTEAREETRRERRVLGKTVLLLREKFFRKMEVGGIKHLLKVRYGGFIPVIKGELVLLINGKERKVLKIR